MHCTLLISQLPQPLPATLRLLAARGQRGEPPDDAEVWLFEAFGVARQRDWPVAPYALLGEVWVSTPAPTANTVGVSSNVPPFEKGGVGGISPAHPLSPPLESPPAPLFEKGESSVLAKDDWPARACVETQFGEGADPGDAYWLRADPVCLRLLRNHLLLFGGAEMALGTSEAAGWVNALNAHFAADGLHFVAPHPLRWYLRLDAGEAPATHPLSRVLGQEVRPWLPDDTRWMKLVNEIQMLLHADPRNDQREAAGLPPLNGVWTWGGGRLVTPSRQPVARVFADTPLALGLARAAGIGAAPAEGAPACLHGEGDPLIVLEAPPAEQLETVWLAPLRAALAGGRLSALSVVIPQHLRVEVRRRDLWKFWRRA